MSDISVITQACYRQWELAMKRALEKEKSADNNKVTKMTQEEVDKELDTLIPHQK